MDAPAYDFWRRERGLEGLEDWLRSHRVEASTVTLVTDTLWFYYWYFLWPVAPDVLPVEISAGSQRGTVVRLTVSMAREGETTHGVRDDELPRLEGEFQREVAEPLQNEVRMEIVFVPAGIGDARVHERVGEDVVGGETEYHTVFVGDLLHDLQSLMPADALERWIDTPNTRFGGRAPRTLLRTPDQHFLRDLILEARHGLPT